MNLSLSNSEISREDSYSLTHEDSFSKLCIASSTPLRVTGTTQLGDESTLNKRPPIGPPISPLSLSPQLPDNNSDQEQSSYAAQEISHVEVQSSGKQLGENNTLLPLPGSVTQKVWMGFKLVGDNIDLTVRPQRLRSDRQTQSLHYFNTMAVRDRIDMPGFSDEEKVIDLSTVKLDSLLPDEMGVKGIRANFSVLVSRVLVKYLPALQDLQCVASKHITHWYATLPGDVATF